MDASHTACPSSTLGDKGKQTRGLSPPRKPVACCLLPSLGPLSLSLDSQLEGGLFSQRLGGHEDCVSFMLADEGGPALCQPRAAYSPAQVHVS